jgi:hypothetical protein
MRLRRAGPANGVAAALRGDAGAAARRARTTFFFLRVAFALRARRAEVRAVLTVFAGLAFLATARFRPFGLFRERRLSFFRTRFAMTTIPFKCLTGFG